MDSKGAHARFYRHYAVAVLLALAIALAGTMAPRSIAFLALIENWILDFRVAYLAPVDHEDSRIAIVGITEDTLATLPYRNPVDRQMLAGLIKKANAADARAIAFDFLFDQATEPEKDAALQEEISASRVPVIIGLADQNDGLTERQSEFLGNFSPAAVKAYVNLVRDDRDGVVRELFRGRTTSDAALPSLAIAAAQAAGGDADAARDLIRFRIKSDGTAPFPVYPAHTLPFVPDAWLKDKILFVGAVLPHEDRHVTPLVSLLGVKVGTRPGVEIHTHVAAQILDQTGYRRAGFALEVGLSAVLALVGIFVGLADVRALVKIIVLAGVFGIVWGVGVVWPAFDGPMLALFAPTLVLGAATGGGAALGARRHRKEKRFIREAMSRYVSPDVVAELQRDPSRLRLGGERRDLTVIFTDIAGFTTTSEITPPEKLVAVLNAYLDGMSELVLKHGGMIDKYIGDAVVAIFNAPVSRADHAARAIACARDMNAFSRMFLATAKAQNVDLGVTRIGVHTGAAIVGNIGGEQRFDYTAIGDTMNTAARLESVNKYLGTSVCISDAAVRGGAAGLFRPVGELVLKGKTQGLLVHEPVEVAADAYLAAFEALAKGHVETAERLFLAILEDVDDPLSRLHLARIQRGQQGIKIVLDEK